ncbi:FHA domain-containing protein At4g14490-like [Chenopodium quinoa]|uniref:FHA domain-containing protein At4g14490-like n=1 Tax=Chenopodium quinoa TaxID=63459 RepID=UPI000B7892A9|nr:FHA domain-containing protein At4g14490-like [Chenopodium quinoa]
MASSKSSTLKLVMQQGPRQGETLEFTSRSTVRIGRVVKGNNLTIKDSGISSKHLIIQFNPDSGNWEIKDLDSSNGTILNSSQLKPLFPSVIQNGDEIKIGELTSIRVEIAVIQEETNNRRITRNRKAAIDLGTKVIEGSNLEIGDEIDNPSRRPASNSRVGDLNVDSSMVEQIPKRRGRGRQKKEDEHVENLEGVMRKRNTRRGEVEFLGLEQVMQPRRTRRGKNAEVEEMPISVMEESKGLDVDVDDCKEVVENNKTRGGRGRKKKPIVRSLDNVLDVLPEEKMDNHEVLEKEVPQQQSCEDLEGDKMNEQVLKAELSEQEGGALSLKEQDFAETMDETTQQEKGLCGIEGDAMLDDRRMEDTEAVEDVLEEEVNSEVLGKELPEKVVNLRQQPCIEGMDASTEQNVLDDKTNAQFLEGVVLDQDGGAQCVREQHCAEEGAQQDGSPVGVSHVEERVCNGVEIDVVLNDEVLNDEVLNDGRVEESDIEEIVKESEVKCYDRSKEATIVPDLEKMTLGEWFDYLEVYLPKQIYAATDEIIEVMQKRAKQFDEFMLQQQKEKKTAFGFGKDDDLD